MDPPGPEASPSHPLPVQRYTGPQPPVWKQDEAGIGALTLALGNPPVSSLQCNPWGLPTNACPPFRLRAPTMSSPIINVHEKHVLLLDRELALSLFLFCIF